MNDFLPKTGGIAKYLSNFIEKYLDKFSVEVIIPSKRKMEEKVIVDE